MNKRLIYLAGLLVLAVAAFSGSAQEVDAEANNATVNNTTVDNTTLNSSTIDIAAAGEENASVPDSANNSSINAVNLGGAVESAQNLSTASSQSTKVAPISQMAGVAPLVAAGASSIQVAGEEEFSYKIGAGVGGVDPFKPEHIVLQPLSLGLPIKPLRDTGKMFFVCDIV